MRFVLVLVALVAALALSPATAAPVTLTDCNSTFVIDPTDNLGAATWTVDGVDQLFTQQWFYRLGSAGTVYSINQLGNPVVNPYLGTQGVDIKYTQNTFTVNLGYTLTGGSAGSGASDVSEIFRIKNTGTSVLSFDLFEYSDFDLKPFINDDYAMHVNQNTVSQWDTMHVVTESVVRIPDRWQVSNPFVVSGDLSNSAAFIGPTDCAWAFQWNLVIDPGSSVVFSKNKAFTANIPEPMSMLLGVMGLATVAGFRRFRK